MVVVVVAVVVVVVAVVLTVSFIAVSVHRRETCNAGARIRQLTEHTVSTLGTKPNLGPGYVPLPNPQPMPMRSKMVTGAKVLSSSGGRASSMGLASSPPVRNLFHRFGIG